VVVAVDFEDAETGKMEAGSGIDSAFPRVISSATWAPLECEGGEYGRFDSDSGEIDSVDVADDTGDIGGKELEERRDLCSGADGVTAAIDMSSPRGEWGTGGCDTMVVGVRGDSGMEVGLERGELGVGSDIFELPARGSPPTPSTSS